MRVANFSPASLAIPAAGDLVKVITIRAGAAYHRQDRRADPGRTAGLVQADLEQDILKLAVVERHRGTGNVGLGLVQGFGLQQGALASSVAHDSHNLIVVGADDHDMWTALRHLRRSAAVWQWRWQAKSWRTCPCLLPG